MADDFSHQPRRPKNLSLEIYRQTRDAILNGLLSPGARRAIEAGVAIQISRFAVNPIERADIVLDTVQSRRIKLKKDCAGFGDAFEIDYSGSPHNWPGQQRRNWTCQRGIRP